MSRGAAVSERRYIVVIGTRPEAIKMAPLVRKMRDQEHWNVRLCVTAQHRDMLDSILHLFGLIPDVDLNLMRPGQTLASLTVGAVEGLTKVYKDFLPHRVLVHGDTTTAMAAAMAAFYEKIPVAHVEAGLRTGDVWSPWPEEFNRRVVGLVTDMHLAPTEAAKENLLKENVSSKRIWVTGNTVVDALLATVAKIEGDSVLRSKLEGQFRALDPVRPLILVTAHRRENFGKPLASICAAIRDLVDRLGCQVVFPVHPNPNIKKVVEAQLKNSPFIHLVEPLEYAPFVYLMSKAHLILTDSGGVQEEAPSLGRPVLVMRDATERPEAVAAGTVLLVGADRERIFKEAERLLTDPVHYLRMSEAHNPYGDGRAIERILSVLAREKFPLKKEG